MARRCDSDCIPEPPPPESGLWDAEAAASGTLTAEEQAQDAYFGSLLHRRLQPGRFEGLLKEMDAAAASASAAARFFSSCSARRLAAASAAAFFRSAAMAAFSAFEGGMISGLFGLFE